MFDFKKLLHPVGNKHWLFNLVLIVLVLSWLVWLYFISFSPVRVQINRTVRPSVDIDKGAQATVDKYIESIASFALPDYNSLYSNPEPFREYR